MYSLRVYILSTFIKMLCTPDIYIIITKHKFPLFYSFFNIMNSEFVMTRYLTETNAYLGWDIMALSDTRFEIKYIFIIQSSLIWIILFTGHYFSCHPCN